MSRKRKYILTLMITGILILAVGVLSYAVYKKQFTTVVQHPDQSGLQAMFYTIQRGGKLIVVDGGWEANADYVRAVIEENGGVVDAWIITHPHPDHTGAFNVIYPDPKGIEIKEVYTIDLPCEDYQIMGEKWDKSGFEAYKKFRRVTEGADNLHYLYAGDELRLCGLKIKVLSAYNDEIKEISTNYANDGSLAFTVTNKKETMLFCADIGKDIGKLLAGRYGDELKCDYIQMGHHGNGGPGKRFYRLADPYTAFFDASEDLMNPKDPDSKWTTPQNRELMESLGAEIYYYATAPNSIRLR